DSHANRRRCRLQWGCRQIRRLVSDSEHAISSCGTISTGCVHGIGTNSGGDRTMSKVSLVVSDVDGTLVTTDKVLTERNRAAVARLREAGIGFPIMSSRPPFGVSMLIEPLSLRLPIGAFNGAVLVAPDLSVIERSELSGEVARDAVSMLRAAAVGIWA